MAGQHTSDRLTLDALAFPGGELKWSSEASEVAPGQPTWDE